MDCIAIKFNLRAKASIRVYACWFWIRDEGRFVQTRNLLVWFAVRHTEPSVTYKAKPAANKKKERKETSDIFCALKGLRETRPVDIFVLAEVPTKIAWAKVWSKKTFSQWASPCKCGTARGKSITSFQSTNTTESVDATEYHTFSLYTMHLRLQSIHFIHYTLTTINTK